MKQFLRGPNIFAALLSLLAIFLYTSTLARTVTFIDSGELAAVAATLGISHPTGYPLFTMLGWLFVHLPLGFRPIVRLNLMAAFLCSVSIFFFFKLSLLFLSDQKEQPTPSTYLASATGAVVLAFSETSWSQALSIEVYSLHLLFLSLLLYLFLKALGLQNNSAERSAVPSALWYGFAFVLGLSFTNHMTTILLAPGFLYLFFTEEGFSRGAWLKLVRAVVPFLAGLSPYLYLPLRAAQSPMLNWGNPTTFERIFRHISGKQYRVWIFSSFDAAEKQLKYFLGQFPIEFSYVFLLFAAIGLIDLYRRRRRFTIFTLILFLTCLLYSINYDIHDIDAYFLLAYVVTGIWVACGVRAVLGAKVLSRRPMLAASFCVGVGLIQIVFQFPRVDARHNYVVEDYTKNMFDSLDKDALVLSYQWDYFVSASYYVQLVEGYRKDVVVIDKELLRRSWYFKQLERQHPQLIESSRREVDEFLKELYKFEHNLPYDPAVIQSRFEEMIHGFLQNAYGARAVYVTPEIEPEFLRGFQKVPSGLAFRLYEDTTYHPMTSREFTFRPILGNDKYSEAVRGLYASAYVNEGIYLAVGGNKDSAVAFLQKALEIKPGFREAIIWLQRFGVQR